ncbi:terminase small subunit [Mucilaginibacter sp.]|uniref:terminase small subunit n=1 Tax=Mucilaginibacter sp. TaxID=1882438 RepID=UPI0035BC751E
MYSTDQPHLLAERIDAYFAFIKGEYHFEESDPGPIKKTTQALKKIVWDRLPEPALLTGLAHFLGFASRQDFEKYEQKGKYRRIVKKARLRVEAEYEKRLHQQSPTGAIFALKSMGWVDRLEIPQATMPKNLQIVIIDAGPQIARTERDVLLQ